MPSLIFLTPIPVGLLSYFHAAKAKVFRCIGCNYVFLKLWDSLIFQWFIIKERNYLVYLGKIGCKLLSRPFIWILCEIAVKFALSIKTVLLALRP